MASNTTRLGLLKKNPATDGADTFNIKTMLNDNWDAIDAKVATLGPDGKVPASQLSISAPADATTAQKGVVQLNDNTDSNSVAQAATANAVRKVKEAVTTHEADDATAAHKISNITGLQSALNGKQATLPTEQKRNIYISTAPPAAPVNGDIWIEV